MAFPITRSAFAGSQGANATSWTLTYPGAGDILDGGSNAIEAGDLIMVNIARDGSAGTGTITDYQSLFDSAASGNVARGLTFVKVASGSESGNFTYTPGASEQGVWRVAVIKNWYGTIANGVEASTAAVGANANPDPPNFDPSWGTEDTFWRAVFAADDGRTNLDSYPTNYGIYQNADKSNGSGGANMGSAGRQNAVAAENPGTFTKSGTGATAGWVAWVVAVRPAPPSANAPAGVASATATAHDATVAIGPAAGVASATGTAEAPSAALDVNAGVASETATAHDATVSTGTDSLQVLTATNSSLVSAAGTTWVDVCEIAAGSFTANANYLILAHAYTDINSAAEESRVRLVRGTTPTEFTDAYHAVEQFNATSKDIAGYMYKFTQPATTELVKLQVSSSNASFTANVRANSGRIIAINLDDIGTDGTDYYYNEVTADFTTDDLPTTQANVTVNPNGTDQWLFIGSFAINTADASLTSWEARLRVGATTRQTNIEEGEDNANEQRNRLMLWAGTPASGSQSAEMVFLHETVAHTVFSSRIFALNLTATFAQVGVSSAQGPTSLVEGSGWVNVAQVALTPSSTGNFMVLGSAEIDYNTSLTNQPQVRMRHNNSGSYVSEPAYGDDGPGFAGQSAWDGTDQVPWTLMAVVELTSGAERTVQLDGQMAATGVSDPNIDSRSLVVVSLGATASATANAEVAAATVTAHAPTPSVAPGAGLASATATAHDATVAITAGAGVATSAVVAEAASANVSPAAGLASATTTSHDASIAATVEAGLASATSTAASPSVALDVNTDAATSVVTAYDATVDTATSTEAPAEVAAATVTAPAAEAALAVSAGVAAATATAHDATVEVAVSAEVASASVTATDATATVEASAEAATATVTAPGPSVALDVNTDAAAATGTAYDATVSTETSTEANAEVASATATAHDASVLISVSAEAATGSVTSHDASAAVEAGAGLANAATTAYEASGAISAVAGVAAATVTAEGASAALGADAGLASATVSVEAAVAELAVAAEVASAAVTAEAPTARLDVNTDVATASVTANAATVTTETTTEADAGVASAVATAYNATVAIGPAAGLAVGTVLATDGAVSLEALAGVAAATVTAPDPAGLVGALPGAEVATATATAWDATVLVEASAGVAAASVSALGTTVLVPDAAGVLMVQRAVRMSDGTGQVTGETITMEQRHLR